MKVLKIIGRVIFWIVIGFFILMIGAALALQTRPVKNKVAAVAESQLNKILDADVRIGRIEGNFFANIILKDISFKQKNRRDTIAIFPSIKLKYRLFPLLQGIISVKSLEFDKPYVSLVQYADSTWNVQKIVRPSEKEDTVSGAFNMVIDAQEVKINDASVRVSSLIKNIPKRVNQLFLDLALDYSELEQAIALKELRFVAEEPNLVLKKLTFNANRDTNLIRVEDFLLKTAQNQIKGNVNFYPKFTNRSTLDIQTKPLYLEEFKAFVPNLDLKPHPVLSITSEFDTKHTHLRLNVKDKTQKLTAEVSAENVVQKFIQNQDKKVVAHLKSEFENIDLRSWLNNPEMNYIVVGHLNAKVEGIDPETMSAEVVGDLSNSVVLDKRLNLATFDLSLVNQQLSGYLNAAGSFGRLHVKPQVTRLLSDIPNYTLGLNAQRLNLAALTDNKQLKSNINFNGTVRGSGFAPKTMTAGIKGVFSNSEVYSRKIERLNVDLLLAKQRFNGQLNGKGDFGGVRVQSVVDNVFAKNPNYTLALQTEQLNLAKLVEQEDLTTDLNIDGKFRGTGFDPKRMTVDAEIKLNNSTAKDVTIDDLHTSFTFRNYNFDIQELIAKTATVRLEARGVYSMYEHSDLSVDIGVKDETEIVRFVELDSFQLRRGVLKGRLFGKMPHLNADVSVAADSIRYQDFHIGNLKASTSAELTDKIKTFDGRVDISDFKTGNFRFNTINVTAKPLNETVTDVKLLADGSEIKTRVSSSLQLGDEIKIGLSDLMLNYKGSEWNLAKPEALIAIGKEKYTVQNLKLVSGEGDSIQTVFAHGVINQAGKQDLNLIIENLNLQKIMQLAEVEQNIKGNFYLDLKLTGAAQNPLLNGSYRALNVSVNNYNIPRFDGEMSYADSRLGLQANVVPQDSGRLTLNGYIPFLMALDSMQFQPLKGKELNMRVLAEKLPLSILKSFQPIDRIQGYAGADVVVTGTIDNPSPAGTINIEDGAMTWRKYGIDYRTILANVHLKTQQIVVDTFLISSARGGYMAAKGNAGFRSQFYLGDFNDSKINVRFQNFFPFNHRLFNAELNGDVNLQGVRDSLVFNGGITVLQSLFYLPAVMDLFGRSSTADIVRPILITELERQNLAPESVIFTLPRDTVQSGSGVGFNPFKSMQGRLKLTIPRNTWIRNEQLRMELMGDVDIYKYRDYLELFGTVDVVRGQYEMLGRTFVVKSGNLVFEGGREINPRLNIEASYVLRTPDKQQKDLRILATGTLQKPELKFTLNDEQLSEGDAVSYIVFGTSMDNVTSGQNLGGGDVTAQGLAGSAAASLVSSQLTQMLGKTLNVDYIEFKTTGAFDQASFVVGKYITNNLFMSYERRFGNYKDTDKPNEYEVRLEYELLKFLFLQLTSSPLSNGIDAIIKLNSR